ncbi:tRNA (N6-isopentenyl adenosine(37)-C2)-methylthiotransferase MiaB [Candidatus Xianfuyuplasma coldseepsis]|uniref:tRNA-2-methylthio-N(6)-dimethylallyladenosine synthase n=1 Tax=Candidatus Xianfuyuplasma coldseepsis TaxID=2782163 RepID=A0A7L7KUG9_9MOLU|nr:tRNA (N6-isopentenyl adenosine(37)-C2)-methylthiotransferase MiaB [Xianfuyuplasma coldseepsis]QMS85644.1 tRNA (N6-isopentenyl adenosine(37)-C2)-methylthiotransferase MiaB [Xianfuyuplasma coldseepsis]
MAKDYSKYFIKPSIRDARKRRKEDTPVLDFDDYFNIQGIGNGKTYRIETYGCQGNEADSEKIRGILEALDFTQSDDLEHADLILLNTCAVRENAENRVFGELGRLKQYKRNNPDLILGVCGCMPQEEQVVEKILKRYHYVDLVFGTHNIYKLPEYLETVLLSKERVIEVFSEEGSIVENMPKIRENTKKAWVNIMYGCDEFCTYCIVPYTRGKERSRLPEHILHEVQELIDQGYQEVTLLGQNVNSYGNDFTDRTYRFKDLLNDLHQMDIARVRFTTSHPKDFDEETVQILAKGGNLMPYIHLPVQSGSNEVLKRMNRKYTKEEYYQLVDHIYHYIPHASLTTDIIVGFPGETEEQFAETLELVEYCRFEGAFTFIYSKREGTPAASYEDDVPMAVKKERLARLNKIVNKGYLHGSKRFEGKTVKVLVDGTSKNNDSILAGYTENNKLVNFAGPTSLIGQIVDVTITESKTWFMLGEYHDGN